MKKILIILFLLITTNSYSQKDSLLLFNKDTIFITYHSKLKDSLIIKEYTRKKMFSIEMNSIYFLMSNKDYENKKKYFNTYEEYAKKGNTIGATSINSGKYGLYFYHKSYSNNALNGNDSIIKLDIAYQIFKKSFDEKRIDSLSWDSYVFNSILQRYYPPMAELMFTEMELMNKRTFNFDGTENNQKELIKLAQEGHYFFILDDTWQGQNLDSKFSTTLFYIFKEVKYRNGMNAYIEMTGNY